VNAFRSMMHDDMMVGAFSHSTAVGKLRKDLPDVPADARVNLPRYTLDEAATVCHYYLRYAKDIEMLARVVLLLIVLRCQSFNLLQTVVSSGSKNCYYN
jgi:hypothetical protein